MLCGVPRALPEAAVMSFATLAVSLALTLVSPPPPDDVPKSGDAAKKEADALRGTWTLASAERGGKAVDLKAEQQIPKGFVFADGGKVTLTGDGRAMAGT